MTDLEQFALTGHLADEDQATEMGSMTPEDQLRRQRRRRRDDDFEPTVEAYECEGCGYNVVYDLCKVCAARTLRDAKEAANKPSWQD